MHYGLPGRCFAKMDQRQRKQQEDRHSSYGRPDARMPSRGRCRQQRRIFFKEQRDAVADVAEAPPGVFFEAAAQQAADAGGGVRRAARASSGSRSRMAARVSVSCRARRRRGR